MSLCCYDYCKFEVGSYDPAEITDWEKLLEAIRECKDVVRRVRSLTDGGITYRLKSYYYCGSILITKDDARKLVEEHGVPMERVTLDKWGDMNHDFALDAPF